MSASRRSWLTNSGGCSRQADLRNRVSGRNSFGSCRSGCRAPGDRGSSQAALLSTSCSTSSSRSSVRRVPRSATPACSVRTTPTGPSPPTSTQHTAPDSSASRRAWSPSSPRGRSSPPNTATSSRRSPSRPRTSDRERSCQRSIETASRCCSVSTPRSISRRAHRARRRHRVTCRSDARPPTRTADASRASARDEAKASSDRWC